MTKSIYPDIEIIEQGQYLEFRTILRKDHHGKYYHVLFIKKHMITQNLLIKKAEIKATELQSFYAEVYLFLILGKIDTDLTYQNSMLQNDGEHVFKLDPDQRSEEERLKSTYLIGGVI